MLTRWLTLTAFLCVSAHTHREGAVGRGSVTVRPTSRVEGQPEELLTLNCGDGKNTGLVQLWHTPFGDLHSPGVLSKLDPVFMHQDGALIVPNSSSLHSGLYYCLLQHTQGTTLWPYELHIGQRNREYSEYDQTSSGDAFRFRRDVGSEEPEGGVSDGLFVGAVAASVLLTFVFGFSAGALSRTRVLRCLGVVTKRLRSPRQQQRCHQTDTPDHGSDVTMTTLSPTYDNHALDDDDKDSVNCVTMETTVSSTSSFPPVKPQRSFKKESVENAENADNADNAENAVNAKNADNAAYLEGCGNVTENRRIKEEVVARISLEENNQQCVGEPEKEERDISGENGGSQTDTDEDSDKDGESSEEVESECDQEKELKERDEQQNNSSDDGHDTEKHGVIERTEPTSSSTPRPARRRSRVIRLYQYDEEGQRYGHLPADESSPSELSPAPLTQRQRSLSLTRLQTIMAAATASPLDSGQTEDKPHFHMEI